MRRTPTGSACTEEEGGATGMVARSGLCPFARGSTAHGGVGDLARRRKAGLQLRDSAGMGPDFPQRPPELCLEL
jgi:hypothetical protein